MSRVCHPRYDGEKWASSRTLVELERRGELENRKWEVRIEREKPKTQVPKCGTWATLRFILICERVKVCSSARR